MSSGRLAIRLDITSVSVVAGSSAQNAGKFISCSGNSCLVIGMNSTVIADGSVAVATFQIASNPTSATIPIQIASAVISSAAGSSIPGSGSSGTIAVPVVVSGQPPAGVISFSPVRGATGVSLTPVLTWGAASGASSYDVYFGTAPSAPFVANTTNTSYSPAPLTASTMYYWRVVSRNAAGSKASDTLSFTTAAIAHPPFFAR